MPQGADGADRRVAVIPSLESAVAMLRAAAMARYPNLYDAAPDAALFLVVARCDFERGMRAEVIEALEPWVERGVLSREAARAVSDRPLDALDFFRARAKERR